MIAREDLARTTLATEMKMKRLRRSTLALGLLVLGAGAVPELAAQERMPAVHGLYSDAVRVGDLVFLSGVVSAHEDPVTQFRQVFARIGQILEQAGSGLDRVVDMTTYHIDMHEHIDAFIAAKNEALDGLPTWTAVGVTELFSPGVFIEVKIIAAVEPEGGG